MTTSPIMDNDWQSMFQPTPHPAYDNLPKSSIVSPDYPTPPLSHTGSPVCEEEDHITVSVSTTFFPGAQHYATSPDIVLMTTDSVFFYVHSEVLLQASNNRFGSLIQGLSKESNPVVTIHTTSPVLNIILHAIYDMPCEQYSPTFETLVSAVNQFPTYGLSPKTLITPKSPFFPLLLSHAPLFPMEVYALAASFDLYELAVSASSHLLSFQISTLSDEMAQRIGPIYLKRLFFLHFGRSDALKRILWPPPVTHVSTETCSFSEQKRLSTAWSLASGFLAFEARPDLSAGMMESALNPLADHVDCKMCKKALERRIRDLIVEWAIIKCTI